MTCGLSEHELFILDMLYRNRNLNTSAGYHCKKLEKIYIKKYSIDFDDVIRKLMNTGYIGPIKKKDMKYYISDIPMAIYALKAHGYKVILGKVRPL